MHARCCGFSQVRLPPSGASATAQLHRHQVVVGLRETRAGEAHQHAALFDPRSGGRGSRRQRADIRHHDHRQFLVEELGHRLLRAHRGRRAGYRQKARARGRDKKVEASSGCAVSQVEPRPRRRRGAASACRAVARRRPNVRPRFPAARCRCAARPAGRRRLRLAIAIAKAKRASPIGEPLASTARTVPIAARPSGRSTFTVIFAAAFSAAASASGAGAPSKIVSARSPIVLASRGQEFAAAAGIGAVGEPGDLGIAGGLQETLDRRQASRCAPPTMALARSGAARRARCRRASA